MLLITMETTAQIPKDSINNNNNLNYDKLTSQLYKLKMPITQATDLTQMHITLTGKNKNLTAFSSSSKINAEWTDPIEMTNTSIVFKNNGGVTFKYNNLEPGYYMFIITGNILGSDKLDYKQYYTDNRGNNHNSGYGNAIAFLGGKIVFTVNLKAGDIGNIKLLAKKLPSNPVFEDQIVWEFRDATILKF